MAGRSIIFWQSPFKGVTALLNFCQTFYCNSRKASQVAEWWRICLVCQWRRCKRCGFDPWIRKIPWSMKWQPTPVFLPGKSQGQRRLVGYSPRGCKESDMTEHTAQEKKKKRKNTWARGVFKFEFLSLNLLDLGLQYFLFSSSRKAAGFM